MVILSAHGLVHPNKTAFCGTIEGKEIFPNGNFHTSPEPNVASFFSTIYFVENKKY
jgi:hypothetical protein